MSLELPESWADVVKRYHGLFNAPQQNLREIANDLNVSQTWVGTRLEKAYDRLQTQAFDILEHYTDSHIPEMVRSLSRFR